MSNLSRFTTKIVTLAKKAVVGVPAPPNESSSGRYADWVIVAIYGFREFLDQPYRRLLDMLIEMPRIVEISD